MVDNDTVTDLIAEGGLVAAKGPPGTVLIFGDILVHGSSINMSPWPRVIFSLILNPVSNAPDPPPASGLPASPRPHPRRPLVVG